MMSMSHPVEIECPKCGAKNAFTVHQSINVTLDPKNKDKVLDRSLFRYHCQKCGHESDVEYGPIYHDMDEKYMILTCADKQTARNAKIPDFRKDNKFSLQIDEFRFRTVCRISGLIEKIKIFDSKLSDYAVELVKLMVLPQTKGATDLFFDKIEGNQIFFFVCYNNEDEWSSKISLARKYYDVAVEWLSEKKIDEDVQYVDIAFIAQYFANDDSR